MFISSRVYEALLDIGMQVVDQGDGSVDLLLPPTEGGWPVRVQVKTRSRSIGPSEVEELSKRFPGQHFVLVAPSFSHASRHAIEEAGWSWIADREDAATTGTLHLPGREPRILGAPAWLAGDSQAQEPAAQPVGRSIKQPARQGRKPWQRFAIIRHLLLGSEWTQRQLADVCDVTQPRVSQVLTQLEADHLVRRRGNRDAGAHTWTAKNLDDLLDTWLQGYPGPGGLAPSYWYGLGNLAAQTQSALTALRDSSHESGDEPGRERDGGGGHVNEAAATRGSGRSSGPEPKPRAKWSDPRPIASGDAAADLIAPYRSGRLALIYSPRGVDLTKAGFTPAPRADATLKLVVPRDSSIWPHPVDDLTPKLAPKAPYPIADAVQVIWDILDEGRVDADQAASAVRRSFIKVRTALG